MAAVFAASSQLRHWTFSEEQLASARSEDHSYMTQDEYRAMQMYLYQLVRALGQKLSLRQQPMATAMVYLLRFYTKAALVETSVYLVAAAALYLACKIEECPQHIKTVTQEIQTVWGLGKVSSDPTKLAEAEFYLINELDTNLIVYHPYRILNSLVETLKVPQRDIDEAWLIINDSYSTDIPLIFSPDVIAYTSLYMTIIRRRYSSSSAADSIKTFTANFVKRNLDIQAITRCTRMFLSFWAFRNTSKVDAKLILKRATEAMERHDSGIDEKEEKTRRYREKILALEKRAR